MIGDNLRHLWFGIPPVSNVRGQPSGSMVVHLEVFTNRATRAVWCQDIPYTVCQHILYTLVLTDSADESSSLPSP